VFSSLLGFQRTNPRRIYPIPLLLQPALLETKKIGGRNSKFDIPVGKRFLVKTKIGKSHFGLLSRRFGVQNDMIFGFLLICGMRTTVMIGRS